MSVCMCRYLICMIKGKYEDVVHNIHGSRSTFEGAMV